MARSLFDKLTTYYPNVDTLTTSVPNPNPHPTVSKIKKTKKRKHISMPANLPLWNRSDPTQRQVDSNRDDPNDPKHLCVIPAIVPEDDCKNDASEVT